MKIDLNTIQNYKTICLPRSDFGGVHKKSKEKTAGMAVYVDAQHFTKGNHEHLC